MHIYTHRKWMIVADCAFPFAFSIDIVAHKCRPASFTPTHRPHWHIGGQIVFLNHDGCWRDWRFCRSCCSQCGGSRLATDAEGLFAVCANCLCDVLDRCLFWRWSCGGLGGFSSMPLNLGAWLYSLVSSERSHLSIDDTYRNFHKFLELHHRFVHILAARP